MKIKKEKKEKKEKPLFEGEHDDGAFIFFSFILIVYH